MNWRKLLGLITAVVVTAISLRAIYFVSQHIAVEQASTDDPAGTRTSDAEALFPADAPAPGMQPVSPDQGAPASDRRDRLSAVPDTTEAPVAAVEAPRRDSAQGLDRSSDSRSERKSPVQQQQGQVAQREPAPVPAPALPPRQHIWEVLLENQREACGYALYTYVIFTRRIAEQALLQASTVARYRALLAAITTSTPQRDEAPSFAPGATNIFYIPARHKPASGVLGLEDYDGHVAMRFVSDLHTRLRHDTGRSLKERIATGPGPFLISTLDPQGTDCPASRHRTEDAAPAGILFVDLSTEHPGAMREVVSVYKAYTQEERVTGIERFSSLKIALLSVLLHVDDSIKMVEMAAAEIVPD